MSELNKCICGNGASRYGLCEECKILLKAKKMKDIAAVEKLRNEYNSKNDTYKTYGQFVCLVDAIYRRKKEIDNRRKKASIAKVRAVR